LSKEDNNNNPVRPETDRGAVLIDTICGSKGLSYPIVFLPDLFYTGKSFDSDKLTRMFHDAGKLCYVPPIPDANKPKKESPNELKEKNELFQEYLRKAYVAFTRAKYYCRFYCGKLGNGLAATDWLFRDHDITDPENAYEERAKIRKAPWKNFSCEFQGDIQETYTPSAVEETLRRPDLMPYLVSQSGFLSFSSITPHGGSQSTLALDREDETDVEPEKNSREDKKAPATVSPTMELPAGTTFGNAIHAIMEECDYKADCDTLALHVQEQGLREDTTVQETAKMLFNVLNAPIPACDGGTFKLSETDPLKKKCEFDFLYEFGSKFRTKELFAFAKNYFEKKFNLSCPDFTDESTTFDNGFFNGSIDLFFQQDGKFYIVDWKTNKLASIKHYSESALPCAMADSRYYLQYMIYTIALFKYLRERLPGYAGDEELYNSCFGGVRYIFLRGTYEKGHGIFSDRLSYDDLKKLEEIIG
jgi:exodeoxyribonuclease V beta subunit